MRTTTAYVDVAQVLGDAARELGDLEFRKYGYPAYVSAAQRALATLCHTIPWDVRHFEAEIPESLILKLPYGTNEKSLVVLFNGPQCNFQNVQTLFIKPNMFHKGAQGYVANNTGQGADIVPAGLAWNTNWPDNWLYFAGESDGHLYLSQLCRNFEKIHITYAGLGMECWGDDFRIPEWAREAITDAVILRAAKALKKMSVDKDRQDYMDIIRDKEQATAITNPNGTWLQALGYWGRMDQKERMDVWTQSTWFGFAPY